MIFGPSHHGIAQGELPVSLRGRGNSLDDFQRAGGLLRKKGVLLHAPPLVGNVVVVPALPHRGGVKGDKLLENGNAFIPQKIFRAGLSKPFHKGHIEGHGGVAPFEIVGFRQGEKHLFLLIFAVSKPA